MKTVAVALVVAAAGMASPQQDDGSPAAGGVFRPHQVAKAPTILQGVVQDVEGNIVVLRYKGNTVPRGRQVDISSAAFEDETGDVVKPYPLRANDSVIVVIDPNAPRTWRPTPKPGRPMPMFIRALPLKALAIEKLGPFARMWHVGGKQAG